MRRRDPSPLCSDWGQGGHVFGDMVDGFDVVLAQIDLRQDVAAIAEVEEAILLGGSDGERLAGEGLGGSQGLPVEAEAAALIDLSDLGLWLVVGRLDRVGH